MACLKALEGDLPLALSHAERSLVMGAHNMEARTLKRRCCAAWAASARPRISPGRRWLSMVQLPGHRKERGRAAPDAERQAVHRGGLRLRCAPVFHDVHQGPERRQRGRARRGLCKQDDFQLQGRGGGGEPQSGSPPADGLRQGGERHLPEVSDPRPEKRAQGPVERLRQRLPWEPQRADRRDAGAQRHRTLEVPGLLRHEHRTRCPGADQERSGHQGEGRGEVHVPCRTGRHLDVDRHLSM